MHTYTHLPLFLPSFYHTSLYLIFLSLYQHISVFSLSRNSLWELPCCVRDCTAILRHPQQAYLCRTHAFVCCMACFRRLQSGISQEHKCALTQAEVGGFVEFAHAVGRSSTLTFLEYVLETEEHLVTLFAHVSIFDTLLSYIYI